MKNVIILSLLGALAIGCGKDEGKAGKTAAKPAAGSAAQADQAPADRYAKVDDMVAKAKTSDDFIAIVMECGQIEIDMRGKAAGDPTHQQHCTVAPAQARAKLAIAESTPDHMSVHCITAAMNLEELVEAGVEVDAHKAMLDKVNEACGM